MSEHDKSVSVGSVVAAAPSSTEVERALDAIDGGYSLLINGRSPTAILAAEVRRLREYEKAVRIASALQAATDRLTATRPTASAGQCIRGTANCPVAHETFQVSVPCQAGSAGGDSGERARFEAWAKDENLPIWHEPLDHSTYEQFTTQKAWLAWQARAAHQAPQSGQAPPCGCVDECRWPEVVGRCANGKVTIPAGAGRQQDESAVEIDYSKGPHRITNTAGDS